VPFFPSRVAAYLVFGNFKGRLYLWSSFYSHNPDVPPLIADSHRTRIQLCTMPNLQLCHFLSALHQRLSTFPLLRISLRCWWWFTLDILAPSCNADAPTTCPRQPGTCHAQCKNILQHYPVIYSISIKAVRKEKSDGQGSQRRNLCLRSLNSWPIHNSIFPAVVRKLPKIYAIYLFPCL
jgi:hypothetical protein